MTRSALNPFLPIEQYIPDGEPHVLGDHVYLFGSHDAEGGDTYCALDYEFYSAPVGDLSQWTSRGVNYRAQQDPSYSDDTPYMYAPDVVQGNDGRYYLYYCMAGWRGKHGYDSPMSVAVSDEPDGTYAFLGHVRNPDGSVFNDYVLFDPALINDSGTIRLYFGASLQLGGGRDLPRWLVRRAEAKLFNRTAKHIKAHGGSIQGSFTVELADDMLTVRSPVRRIVPERTKGTGFEGHGFFEGSSIRKIGDTYYFVYSSQNHHELCYATSAQPDRNFVFRGTIVSNGDIGLNGRPDRERVAQTGNNHGGIERIGDTWYVFYHRHTHGSSFSRQACAEPIEILADGSIPQVAVTSCGLNKGPLPAAGEYPAVIASRISNGRMPHSDAGREIIPRVTHDGTDRYIGDITSETQIGYKYIEFAGPGTLTLVTRADAGGELSVEIESGVIGTGRISASDDWSSTAIPYVADGTHELLLRFHGAGTVDLLTLSFAG